MVRSHLEYGQNIWSPIKQKHVDILESVQRRATKILPNLKHLSYSQRLVKLKLPTLTYRRLRGDMIETFKIMHEYYDSACAPELKKAIYSSTRGHSLKLFKNFAKKPIRHNYFTSRIVDTWNSLPADVVNAPSVNAFKNRLDKFWSKHELLINYKAKISY